MATISVLPPHRAARPAQHLRGEPIAASVDREPLHLLVEELAVRHRGPVEREHKGIASHIASLTATSAKRLLPVGLGGEFCMQQR